MPPVEIMETDRVDKLSDKLSNGEQPVPRTALRGNQLGPVAPDYASLLETAPLWRRKHSG